MLGKTEDKRKREQQRMRRLDSVTASMVSLGKLWEMVEDRGAWRALGFMGSQRVGHDLAAEQQ